MNYTIDRITRNDIDGIFLIEQECFVHPRSKTSLLGELDNDNAFFYTVKSGDRALGYGGMNTVLDEGYIVKIAVLKEYRRQGIAQTILDKLYDCCIKKRLSFLTLEVRKSNDAAIMLYQKNGFELLGERKNFYSSPTENALIMTKYFDRNVSLDENIGNRKFL